MNGLADGVFFAILLALGGCYRGGSAGAADGGTGGTDTGMADGGSGSDPSDPPVDAPPDISAVGMRRLSAHEYDRTVFDLVGDDEVGAGAAFPPDLRTPFDNDYPGQIPSRTLVEAAESLATQVVQRLQADTSRFEQLVECDPDDPACVDAFVRRFGRRALRRPVSDEEAAELVELAAGYAEAEGDGYAGIAVVVRELLQDVEFLYRVEIGTEEEDQPGVFRLTPFELATRLSYLIRGTTPSDALLDAADNGELDSPEEVVAAAQDLLDSPRARAQIDRFHAMWLGYDQLQHAPEISTAMRTETRALLDRVIFDDQRPWLELFLADETYVSDELAAHYGLPLPGSADPVWIDYSDQGRRGLLSHGSFLSVAHDVGDTSPVRRGLHVLRRLTCQDVPPPPPDAGAELPEVPSDCRLDQLNVHAEGSCAGCHQLFDPIGFGLEQYDVAGRFRTHEEGKPECGLDGEGELYGVGAFNGPAELGERLVESGLLDTCAVEHLYQYALGREVSDDDLPIVDELAEDFRDSEHRFDTLIIELVSQDAFFFRRNDEGN